MSVRNFCLSVTNKSKCSCTSIHFFLHITFPASRPAYCALGFRLLDHQLPPASHLKFYSEHRYVTARRSSSASTRGSSPFSFCWETSSIVSFADFDSAAAQRADFNASPQLGVLASKHPHGHSTTSLSTHIISLAERARRNRARIIACETQHDRDEQLRREDGARAPTA